MTGEPVVIVAAGMPRSASTWLYNAARLSICSTPALAAQFSCGWGGDLKDIPIRKIMLIKVHRFNPELVKYSRIVLYSYRDVRDALASKFRKFGETPTLETADQMISDHDQWMEVANFVMRYESMLEDKGPLVAELAQVLGLTSVDPASIIQQIEALAYDSEGKKNEQYHSTNLYHRGHITDGRIGSWKGVLDADLVRQIETRHRDWFEKYGYPLSD